MAAVEEAGVSLPMDEDEISSTTEESETAGEIDADDDDARIPDAMAESSDASELEVTDRLEMQRVLQERRVEANVYIYDEHVVLFDILKKLRLDDELLAARERMAEIFPLSEDLWTSWLEDEMAKLAGGVQTVESVVVTFERAIRDYLSPKLWLMYIKFASSREEFNEEDMRKLFDRAVANCGEHLGSGRTIWRAYLDFEQDIHQKAVEANKDKWTQQEVNASLRERLVGLLLRLFDIPLVGLDSFWRDFITEFPAILEREALEERFMASEDIRRQYTDQFESLLAGNDKGLAEHYNTYLLKEKEADAPKSRLRTLYERAVAAHCLDEDLWIGYFDWLRSSGFGDESDLFDVIERSSRNIPWCGAVWKEKMRLQIKYDRELGELRDTMTKAMASGVRYAREHVDLWMTFVNGLHGKLKEIEPDSPAFEALLGEFRAACHQASEVLPTVEGVTNYDLDELLKYQAAVEASLGFMDVARSIWGEILSPRDKPSVYQSLEFIFLERMHGDPKHVRKAFHKAFSRSLERDLPVLCSAYRRYELEFGSVDHVASAEAEVSKYMSVFKDWKEKEFAKNKNQKKPEQNKRKERNDAGKESNAAPGRKRKAPTEEGLKSTPAKTSKVDDEGFKIPRPVGAEDKGPKSVPKKATSAKRGENDDRTVFFSNLDFTTSEEDIMEFVGNEKAAVESVDIIKDKAGKSRGYGYVLMASKEAAEVLLKRDRQNLKGRPAFISPCVTAEKRQPVFKYASGEEPNKLFVSNLSLDVTDQDLATLYVSYGELVSARTITYRNGHSKGKAYVEFSDPAHAKKALMEADGLELKGKCIIVAISNPPPRKGGDQSAKYGKGGGDVHKPDAGSDTGVNRKSLLGSRLSGQTRGGPDGGRRRTQVAFIPRALQGGQTSKAALLLSNGKPSTAKKSNADFRSMLLGKKE